MPRLTTEAQIEAVANALLQGAGELFDGQPAEIVFMVLMAIFAHASGQCDADERGRLVLNLRLLADELEALGATRH